MWHVQSVRFIAVAILALVSFTVPLAVYTEGVPAWVPSLSTYHVTPTVLAAAWLALVVVLLAWGKLRRIIPARRQAVTLPPLPLPGSAAAYTTIGASPAVPASPVTAELPALARSAPPAPAAPVLAVTPETAAPQPAPETAAPQPAPETAPLPSGAPSRRLRRKGRRGR
ncbi:MAG: hypothetical protein AVDCRST_MAG77-3435 [uncultured Chloroflexi bacterium]|uniref:Uncharacterized protein n=1 Tax=uncultured Chloroflexota bacterium TaxID=166587 RepID=A0A6J4JGM5_9CHLR|nr:MAG: hypothetical protein AVDCRST_MAG77-3435 [uncultured Chloroflexota bacterium]